MQEGHVEWRQQSEQFFCFLVIMRRLHTPRMTKS